MPPRLREIGATLGARGVAMLGPLAVSVITARALGPEGRGEYFLVLSYAQIAAQLASLGLQTSNNYLVANRRELLAPLVINGFYVAFLIGPIVAAPFAIFFGWPELLGLHEFGSESTGPLAIMAILITPVTLAYIYLSNVTIGTDRIRLFNVLLLGNSTISVIFAAMAWVFSGSVLTFLIAAAASFAVSGLFAGRRLLRYERISPKFNLDLFKEGIGYAFRAYLSTGLSFLMIRVGALALQQHASLKEVGLFSIAAQLTDGLAQIPGTLGLLLFPMMMKAALPQRPRLMWSALLWICASMLCLLIAAGAIAVVVVPFFFGEAFAESVPLTAAMLPQVLLLTAITVLSSFLAAEGFPWIQVAAWLFGFLAHATGSYFLTFDWGGYGVALSLTISYALVFLVLLFEAWRTSRKIKTSSQGVAGDAQASEFQPINVLSFHSLTSEFQAKVTRLAGTACNFVLAPQLRDIGPVRIIRAIRALGSPHMIVAIENESGRPFAGPLLVVAAFAGARKLDVLWPNGSIERLSYLQIIALVARVLRAQLSARLALLRSKKRMTRLPARAGLRISPARPNVRNAILYLDANLSFDVAAGGSVGHIKGVIEAFIGKGFEVEYASGKPRPSERSALTPIRTPVPELFAFPPELNCYLFNETYEAVLAEITRQRPYMFMYQRMSLHNFTGAWLRGTRGIPLVLEFNGSEPWIAANWGKRLAYDKMAVRTEIASIGNADLVVTVSKALGDQLAGFGVPSDRILVYPNCVDSEIFDPTRFDSAQNAALRHKLNIAPEAKVATFVGTFGTWHGVDFLANAICRLVAEDRAWMETQNLHFLLVGDGAKMSQVRQLLDHEAVQPFVTLTGLIPQSEAPAYLAASDIFLSPHIPNSDGTPFFGSPTKLFEYMAMRRPIIASDLDQIGSVLRNNGSTSGETLAELYEPGSEAAFLQALKRVAGDLPGYEGMAQRARNFVLEEYTWEKHVGAIIERLEALDLLPNGFR